MTVELTDGRSGHRHGIVILMIKTKNSELEHGANASANDDVLREWEVQRETDKERLNREAEAQHREQIEKCVADLRVIIDHPDQRAERIDPVAWRNATLDDARTIAARSAVKDNLSRQLASRKGIDELQQQSTTWLQGADDYLARHDRKILSRTRRLLHLPDKRRATWDKYRTEIQGYAGELSEHMNSIDDEIAATQAKLEELDGTRHRRALSESVDRLPLGMVEKSELLRPEALAQLSTEEYVRLWQHLSPHYMSHVTRQGVRDHSEMREHTAGMGEFQNGFMSALKGGKRLAPWSQLHDGFNISDGITANDVRKVLGKELWGDQARFKAEEVRRRAAENVLAKNKFLRDEFGNSTDKLVADDDGYLKKLADAEFASLCIDELPMEGNKPTNMDPWINKTSVHMAHDDVLSDYYGGESGNEVFFIFPTDVIRTQFFINNQSTPYLYSRHVNRSHDARRNNDSAVHEYANYDGLGHELTIDAGLVFLPKSTKVDRATGSKYKTTLAAGKLTPERDEHGDYILSDDVVSSQDYWEQYFADHPDERPAHVVWYDGDPTDAVDEFLTKNNIAEFNKGRDRFGRPWVEMSGSGETESDPVDTPMNMNDEAQHLTAGATVAELARYEFDKVAARELIQHYRLDCSVEEVMALRRKMSKLGGGSIYGERIGPLT